MIKFTTILHDKREELDISMLEYVILDTVEKLSKPKFRAHRKTLAQFVGMSRGGLIKAINRLVDKGLLVRVNGKEIAVTQKWIDETISSINKVNTGVNKVNTGVNKVDSKCQQSVQPTKKENIQLEPINKEKYTKEFEEWWDIYPKKVAKTAAFKSYKDALNKISHMELITSLTQHDCLKADHQFCPHPTTWLNQERWLDQNKPVKDLMSLSKEDRLKETHRILGL